VEQVRRGVQVVDLAGQLEVGSAVQAAAGGVVDLIGGDHAAPRDGTVLCTVF
jgi:hypothetical protein